MNAAKAVEKPKATPAPATVAADVQPEEDESDFDSEEGVSLLLLSMMMSKKSNFKKCCW